MKKPKVIRTLLRVTIGLLIAALLLIGVGMLPGKIEGTYRGLGSECMCDSVNFMQFREGKVVMYSSNHPPADLIGRYERKPDGTVEVFMAPYKEGESEKLIFRAKPRLWFSRFAGPDDGSGEWLRKHRNAGKIKSTIRDHEIASIMIHEDRTMVKTFYDSALGELRVETTEPKQTRAESGRRGVLTPAPHTTGHTGP